MWNYVVPALNFAILGQCPYDAGWNCKMFVHFMHFSMKTTNVSKSNFLSEESVWRTLIWFIWLFKIDTLIFSKNHCQRHSIHFFQQAFFFECDTPSKLNFLCWRQLTKVRPVLTSEETQHCKILDEYSSRTSCIDDRKVIDCNTLMFEEQLLSTR